MLDKAQIDMVTRVCRVCHGFFEARSNNAQYCPEHQPPSHERRPGEKICHNCGLPFHTRGYKFCSKLCASQPGLLRRSDWKRIKRANDPEWARREDERSHARVMRARLDPEYRRAENVRKAAYKRLKMATDPVFRDNVTKSKNKRRRIRMATDPEYRARIMASRKRRQCERLANDPAYYEKYKQKAKERAHKLYHKKQAIIAAVLELGLITPGDFE